MNQEIQFQVPQILAQHYIHHVVLSPGSRNAPLSISFAQHRAFKKYIIPDERSAAFIALGIAQEQNNPVVLVCTSGSAALNYYPAVAEAFFAHVPLIIITADRPPEWIDQQDGQTIRQAHVFQNHIHASYQLPVDTHHADAEWEFVRKINEAVILAKQKSGPVHLNIPFREPFYPETDITFREDLKIIQFTQAKNRYHRDPLKTLMHQITSQTKVLCIAGQHWNEEHVEIPSYFHIPVLTESISNIKSSTQITQHDLFLNRLNDEQKEELLPNLIITWGNGIISKSLKKFIRQHKNIQHWHITENGDYADTFQCLTQVIQAPIHDFLNTLSTVSINQVFGKLWMQYEEQSTKYQHQHLSSYQHTELHAYWHALQFVKNTTHLHFANSMSIRYANLLGNLCTNTHNLCNRGTSGIDGSISTAIGYALANAQNKHIVITGDMSFFYDRNAWWHNYHLKNIKVILFNNHGGGIFRLIEGPSKQKELEEYFVTHQKSTAKALCQEYAIPYFHAHDITTFQEEFNNFIHSETWGILEIETDPLKDKEAFSHYKNNFNLQ
jgi:2-succinyl-5-enolpyruvyl-6-hydroxy-3-cyclohexene-1-carboxylate synthase